jgi:antitoxin MazE
MRLYNLTEGIAINFSVEGNSIVITPQKKYPLDELLLGMTSDKFHPEFETGNAVGSEDW